MTLLAEGHQQLLADLADIDTVVQVIVSMLESLERKVACRGLTSLR